MIALFLFSNQSHGLSSAGVTSTGIFVKSSQSSEKSKRRKRDREWAEAEARREAAYDQKWKGWVASIQAAKPLAAYLLAGGTEVSEDNAVVFLAARTALRDMYYHTYNSRALRLMEDDVYAAYVIVKFQDGFDVPFQKIEAELGPPH